MSEIRLHIHCLLSENATTSVFVSLYILRGNGNAAVLRLTRTDGFYSHHAAFRKGPSYVEALPWMNVKGAVYMWQNGALNESSFDGAWLSLSDSAVKELFCSSNKSHSSLYALDKDFFFVFICSLPTWETFDFLTDKIWLRATVAVRGDCEALLWNSFGSGSPKSNCISEFE